MTSSLGTAKQCQRLAVQLENVVVVAADDQQRGGVDVGQVAASQVGPTAAGNDRPGELRAACRRDQGRRGAGAAPK